ncbi:lithostathine-1-like [Lingula anatina]|uniref:Lithostathine-1-like n=1 Tax=Lingula anatina TaxID=7574 RepID=A0A1S3JRJ7_LINAN|nr:lithostathine-1-like [Lingula anatina]|eukprot:XP_013412604.1 lithostathine-1-like [Lingula anatina]
MGQTSLLVAIASALLGQCLVAGVICRHGFTKLNNGCYYFDGVHLSTWTEAQSYCQNFGAKLVSVESQDENAAILSHMKQYRGAFSKLDFWTSGNDIVRNGRYEWASTLQPVGPFTAWAKGQPSGGPQHCLHYHNFEWDDQTCDVKNSFICEQNDDSDVFGR